MIHYLFAILFAALVMCMLHSSGLMTRSSSCSACEGEYGWCQVFQDLRCLWSFVLGAFVCSCSEGFYNPLDRLRSQGTGEEESSWKGNIAAGLIL